MNPDEEGIIGPNPPRTVLLINEIKPKPDGEDNPGDPYPMLPNPAPVGPKPPMQNIDS
jgi:hypothetical protein